MSKACSQTCFSSTLGKCYSVHLHPGGRYSPLSITSFLSSHLFCLSWNTNLDHFFLSPTPLTLCYLTLIIFPTLHTFTSWFISLPQVLQIDSPPCSHWKNTKTQLDHNLSLIKISSNSAGHCTWGLYSHHCYLRSLSWPHSATCAAPGSLDRFY